MLDFAASACFLTLKSRASGGLGDVKLPRDGRRLLLSHGRCRWRGDAERPTGAELLAGPLVGGARLSGRPQWLYPVHYVAGEDPNGLETWGVEAGWGINIMMQQATFHNMPMLDVGLRVAMKTPLFIILEGL